MNAYLSIPLIGSAFVEVRQEWLGFGCERHSRGDREIFLGRVQITYSPAVAGVSRRSLILSLAVASTLAAMAIPGGLNRVVDYLCPSSSAVGNFPQGINIPTLDIKGVG